MSEKLSLRSHRVVHPKAHRFVRQAFLRMVAEDLVEKDVCEKAGVSKDTWSRWKTKGLTPDLLNIEAILQVLDMELVIKDRRPPEPKKRGAKPGTDNPIKQYPDKTP